MINDITNNITILTLADIHFGHNKTKTPFIINNLNHFIKDHARKIKEATYIILLGDVYDKLLSSSSEDFIAAQEWKTKLLMLCAKNNIKLRILKGTNSHDREQISVFDTIVKNLDLKVDFKYVDTLEIEHDENNNLDILYVPDDLNPTAAQTEEDIKELMKTKGLTKVGLTCIHGQFPHQLPGVDSPKSHNENFFLDITKHYVLTGHIHMRSVYQRILTGASFDRLKHGEEGEKGGLLCYLNCLRDDEYYFLTNYRAKRYDTVKITSSDLENIYVELKNLLKPIPLDSYVRLDFNNPIFEKSLYNIQKQYPNYMFTLKDKKKEERIVKLRKITKETIAITQENIEEMLADRMEKYELDVDDFKIYKEELSDVI